jgi:predicted permease
VTLLHRLASIVRWVLYKKKLEQQLDEELQVFLDMSAKQKVQDGVPPSEARRLAMLELGGIEQAKEHVRTFRYGALLDQLGKDLRFALRTFAKQPGFVVVVVLTLALGIGANTAIFSLIDALMLRWLPVHNPDELVQVVMAAPGSNPPFDTFSYPIARGLAEQTEIFAGVAGFSSFPFDVGNGDSLSRVSGAVVTGGYYETFGLTAVVGRLLGKEDDEPGAPPVAVISYGFWEREFAHNPGAIGQTLPVNGVPVTLIGVSPAGFVGANVGAVADITIPAAALPQIHPPSAGLLGAGNFWMRILARPSSGVSVQQAGGRLAAIWPQMAERVIASHWPASQKKEFAESVFQLVPGGTGYSILRSMYAKPLKVLMGMVALVLFIACANVANLLLVRGSARQREMAVRLAIGAGRGRIVRQLLTESILLSLIGAACGIALSWLSSRFLLGILSTGSFQVLFDLTPNLHVLGFTAAVAIAIAILFGLAPAFYATSTGPSMALKQDSRSSSRSRLMPFLVTLQVALTLVLVIGASLLVRTLQNLQNLDPGFSHWGSD